MLHLILALSVACRAETSWNADDPIRAVLGRSGDYRIAVFFCFYFSDLVLRGRRVIFRARSFLPNQCSLWEDNNYYDHHSVCSGTDIIIVQWRTQRRRSTAGTKRHQGYVAMPRALSSDSNTTVLGKRYGGEARVFGKAQAAPCPRYPCLSLVLFCLRRCLRLLTIDVLFSRSMCHLDSAGTSGVNYGGSSGSWNDGCSNTQRRRHVRRHALALTHACVHACATEGLFASHRLLSALSASSGGRAGEMERKWR